jgi:Tfp pilus assembly protein PilV
MGGFFAVRRRGFSIVEALIALSLVLMALVGLFGVLPFTFGAIQDDSLRAEASAAGQQYMDRVRIAVQSGRPLPAASEVDLSSGRSMATGESSNTAATLDLSAACAQPDGSDTSLYDCTVTQTLTEGGKSLQLAPLESYATRQL